MNSRTFTRLAALLLLTSVLFGLHACKEETDLTTPSAKLVKDFDATLTLQWYQLFLEIDRYSPGYRPPAAARMLGYTGLAIYEAAVHGMPDYRSLAYEFPGLTLPEFDAEKEYYWPACINAAFASSFRYFYPHIQSTDTYKIATLEAQFMDDFGKTEDPAVLARSREYGFQVAKAVYEFSRTDTYGDEAFYNPFPPSYHPPLTGPGGEKLWQPTWPDFTPALFPYWGSVRPFAMSSSDIISRPPLPYSEDPNSLFYQQANETRIWVNTRTPNDIWTAEFWSDDFYGLTFEPAGRQVAIANILVDQDNITLEEAIELYAKLGMSLGDVAIAVWNSKYIYNVRRPIEYIREVMEPGWKTILNNPLNGQQGVTPPFPSYPSGHSGFAGAGSAVMANIFGDTHPYTDNCHQNRTEFNGTPRSYNTILEAGLENAYSRVQLGVHYRMDCDEGIRLGYLAATRVNALRWH